MIIYDPNKLTKAPIVSVRVITYNHEDFISECLDSILSQKTVFNFEIVIGDDISSDKTRAILSEYQKQYPEKIKLIFNDKNLGSNLNIFETNNHCSGKYIAWCDGDDYWLDNNKLQYQFDLLENCKTIAMSFHNVSYVDANSSVLKPFITDNIPEQEYSVNSLFSKWHIANSSVFFRNGIVTKESPDFVWNGTHGDLMYYILLSENGSIHYSNKIQSTYRIHGQSITSTAYQGIIHNDKHIKQCYELKKYLNGKYSTLINKRVAKYQMSNCMHYARNNAFKESFICFKQSVKNDPLTIITSPLPIIKALYIRIFSKKK